MCTLKNSIQDRGSLLSFRLFLAVMLLLACGCERDTLRTGSVAPEISGQDVSGQPVSLAKLKGRVVMVYFFTNSCCGTAVKKLQPLYRELQEKGLSIIAVNEQNSVREVEGLAKEGGLSFSVIRDAGSAWQTSYSAPGFPTIFILDGNGIVREKLLGDVPPAKLEKLVRLQLDRQQQARQAYEKLHPAR
jgi:peroxiredoxin